MARDMRPVTLEEIEAKMSPEQRARVDKLTAQMRAEEMSLAQLRKAREMTQTALARKLGKTQAHVSRIESAGDLFISTLRKQVEGLGGTLDVRAVFPDMAPVSIGGFKELEPMTLDAIIKLDDPLEEIFKAPSVKKPKMTVRHTVKHATKHVVTKPKTQLRVGRAAPSRPKRVARVAAKRG
jgi:transcriptional regulator with XRE-family HTH domain